MTWDWVGLMIMKDMETGEKLMVITTLKSYEILGYSGNPKYEDVRKDRKNPATLRDRIVRQNHGGSS